MGVSRELILQAVACFVIATAGLVPVFHANRPFWGLSCISFDDNPPRVHTVESDSPASLAGLRTDDVILAVNGSSTDFTNLMSILNGLQQDESVRLRVKRREQERDVTATGFKPPIAMIYYQTIWHPLAGVAGLALGLLVIATQPLRPTPRWRPILLGIVGLVLAIIFFLAIINDNFFSYWQVRRFHNLNGGTKWHFHQNWVGLFASLGLTILGTWELRRLLLVNAALSQRGRSDDPSHD